MTTLVGRDRDLERLSALLTEDTVRLVTITGVGGIGKTRIAIEAARSAASHFTDGVKLAPLAQVADPAFVARAIAEALGIPESEMSADERLVDWLQSKQILLVLDNFEHLPDAAGLFSRLLRACPDLSILVTSRSPLHLAGEWIHRLDPLATGDGAHQISRRLLTRCCSSRPEREQPGRISSSPRKIWRRSRHSARRG